MIWMMMIIVMGEKRIGYWLTLAAFLFPISAAQNQQVEICHGTGSIVIAVIATLIVTLGLLAAGFFLYKTYWRSKEGKHLMLVTDAENPNDQYAFDNPCFREATPCKQNIQEAKQASTLEKNKWLGWNSLNPFGKAEKLEKVTSLDDSYVNDSRLKVVTLKSHDFTGLGFSIYGNMRDGIFVKDILHRGPAFESGCINSGDRIDSICISFRNMVFEDALTILSYASPYDVQVQVENDSCSRPSTLIRSKRESNAVSSAEKIQHPKYSRSQSISHLNEIGKPNSKRIPHRIDFMHEKNRINQSLNKSHEGSNNYPTIKLSPSTNKPKREFQKLENNANVSKTSHLPGGKRSVTPEAETTSRMSGDPQSKLQIFGIRVLPTGINLKSGESLAKTPGEQPKTAMVLENEINFKMENEEKSLNSEPPLDVPSRSTSPIDDASKRKQIGQEEADGARENVKGILAKGFQNLKEKINQNTLGKKKNKDPTSNENVVDGASDALKKTTETKNEKVEAKEFVKNKDPPANISESDCPVPKRRSSVTCGVKACEKNKLEEISMPEEVSRAGEMARSNRKSLNDANFSRKFEPNLISEAETENFASGKGKTSGKKIENLSDSENSLDGDSSKISDGLKRPKRSKGKAPAPPGLDLLNDDKSQTKQRAKELSNSEINEIKRDDEVKPKAEDEKLNIFESDSIRSNTGIDISEDGNGDTRDENHPPSYDSDSDASESRSFDPTDKLNNTKIELNANQVTVHQSLSGDGNEDDVEPSRKAASLGDLSKFDSEQPLSIVLERAVSLDLADGSMQTGKKRKAPLPPPEEFPAVFDENSLGMNTFKGRLKKSSDFGRLEDVLGEGPKSLEIEINHRNSPVDLTETHNSNIQEFSSWLAECRRPKSSHSETSGDEPNSSRISSTSLVNINCGENVDNETGTEDDGGKTQFEYPERNVGFRVNGQTFTNFQLKVPEEQRGNSSGTNSKTVVVISQPNSLEPVTVEAVPVNLSNDEDDKIQNASVDEREDVERSSFIRSEDNTSLEPYVTARESKLESFDEDAETPPKLPSSPIPIMSTSSTLYSPPVSSFTYVTEVKVSTSQQHENGKEPTVPCKSSVPSENGTVDGHNELNSEELKTSTPKPEIANSMSKRIQMFDSKASLPKPFVSPIKFKPGYDAAGDKDGDTGGWRKKKNHGEFGTSKIPIKTMKSETGQKILETIQSLASKETSPPKSLEVEYAKRVASLFSGNSLERNRKQPDKAETETDRSMMVSGFSLRRPETSPEKPPKDFFQTRKIPPVVPPRKTETALSSKSAVAVESTGRNQEFGLNNSGRSEGENEKSVPNETQDRHNIVKFSSFMPRAANEEPTNSTMISFKIK